MPAAIVLTGPTACGKTDAALAIAARFPVEIISVDSALVYRGMDIGTAKPSPAERARVPHHLIDIREPDEPYSAAAFVADARQLVVEIRQRGRTPLLVGGTMLYLRALLHGLDAMPPADPALRAEIDAQARARGWPALHDELSQVDPTTAARLASTDSQRIQRALEVYRSSGRPISAFQSSGRSGAGALPGLPMISLEPGDRAWLHARIERRFQSMMQAGFLDEVRALRSCARLHADLPSMRCVGYRQAWDMLDGRSDEAGWPDRAIAATRQLAKRQITWLRSMPTRTVIPCDQGDPMAGVLAAFERQQAGLPA